VNITAEACVTGTLTIGVLKTGSLLLYQNVPESGIRRVGKILLLLEMDHLSV